jgi:hypothetical protein
MVQLVVLPIRFETALRVLSCRALSPHPLPMLDEWRERAHRIRNHRTTVSFP